eukprot:gnl/MRDRNA2_/MRDRNA2_222377_c0_seq1.p1 gnl/MRDRNA2_/MRDRNA2_222377_c0~~gnl/MRDRNA2_/MRDRNA2_222377_c0_seq1.p1  ORF type:complete len:251 (+),score=53.29 gnl/MRDRNA2_/MRDRNA2_222377_c0_seq1:73-753(+)
MEGISVIVLAGGVGSRMKADRPKQFLMLRGQTILERGLNTFLSLEGVGRIVVVLDEQHRSDFAELQQKDPRIVFANPGTERQDSVCNGLAHMPDSSSFVCIHDAARPLVTKEEIYKVVQDAKEHGAAVLGVPMKATVKESEDGDFVLRTIPRKRLWEIHTPQVIELQTLRRGFDKVKELGLDVTDDVSIVEQLNLPVKLTQGEYTNIKITTPEDLLVAEAILDQRE